MKKVKLGNSDMGITRVGLGTWAIGGPGWKAAWGPQDDKDSIATIHKALDTGINWIDTAAVYGIGHSEEVVGKAISERADKPFLFTKCGRVIGEGGKIEGNLSESSIRKEAEDSLKRLRVDAIDLFQIHWPQPDDGIEAAWETLARLKEEGKLKYIGVSNFSKPQMERIMTIAPITSLQPPYSMIKRDIEENTLPFCKANNIGVIPYGCMGNGLLTGKMTKERALNLPEDDWRSRSEQFNEPLLSKNIALVDILFKIGNSHGVTPAAVAVAWVNRNPVVTGAIVGMRRPDQVSEPLKALDLELSAEQLKLIEDRQF